MTTFQQILSNLTDSTLTTLLGGSLILLGVLCDSGVIGLYLAPTSEHAWCLAIGKLSTYLGGGALMISRSPTTPPR